MNNASSLPLARAVPVLCLLLTSFPEARASISYTVYGSAYNQNFDSLPLATENVSLEATKPWADDTASSGTISGIPGWYLWHPLDPGAEDGTNEHQRFRIGAGTANTGSFYSFGSSGSTDRALGGLNADTLSTPQNAVPAPATLEESQMYIGMQIVNNTGVMLTSFRLSYTGEQWRQAGNNGVGQITNDRLEFQYSLDPASSVSSPNSLYTHVSALDFDSPQTTGAISALDGNLAANRTALNSTVSNIAWAPGTTLFLRWVDTNYPGPDAATRADNGMAIDDLSFSAVPEPACLPLLGLGALLLAGFRRRSPRRPA
jgi:hypothetical protein